MLLIKRKARKTERESEKERERERKRETQRDLYLKRVTERKFRLNLTSS